MNVPDWIKQQPGAWERAVAHPFLDACTVGTIAPESFNRCLPHTSICSQHRLAKPWPPRILKSLLKLTRRFLP